MVSLDAQYGRHSGGMSFDDRLINTTDDQFNENTPLIFNTQQQYRSVRTTFVIITHIIFTILFEFLIILFPYLCYDLHVSNPCSQYSAYNISLYIHVGAFFLFILFDRLYHYYQTISIRHGYLNFDQQTRTLRHLPLIILSIGNSILIVMIKSFEQSQSSFQPWHGLILLATIENILILLILIRYLVLTMNFNKQCLRPDIIQEDDLSTFLPAHSTTIEIGFRDESFKDNILEKQADLIRYLRERNNQLTRLVHQSHRT